RGLSLGVAPLRARHVDGVRYSVASHMLPGLDPSECFNRADSPSSHAPTSIPADTGRRLDALRAHPGHSPARVDAVRTGRAPGLAAGRAAPASWSWRRVQDVAGGVSATAREVPDGLYDGLAAWPAASTGAWAAAVPGQAAARAQCGPPL